ncbi:MAG: response regulator [Oligoflexia bacterium]|nr:response regulator [Oligoflexia bacterium]
MRSAPAPVLRRKDDILCLPNSVLGTVLDILVETLDLSYAAVLQLDGNWLRPVRGWSDLSPATSPRDPLIERIVASPSVVLLEQPRASYLPDCAVCLASRLVVAGTVVGVLFALREQPDGFDTASRHAVLQAVHIIETHLRPRVETTPQIDSSQRFFHLSNDAMAVIDTHGCIATANPAAYALLQLEPPALVGHHVLDLVHPEDLERVTQESAPLVLFGEPTRIEVRLNSTEGPERWAQVTLTADAVARSYYAVLRDITANHKVEQLKSEFLATVSHELRTPLTSIRGALGLVASGSLGQLPPTVVQLIDIANRNATRLIRLVNDILDVERMASGRMVYDMAEVDLVRVVDEAVLTIRAYALEQDITVTVSKRPEGAVIRGDEERLRQVIDNLLANAVRFSPAGQTVSVGISVDSRRVRVDVQDHGPGIAPEFEPHIFERFAQAAAPDARGHSGSGLGLNISRSIIEAHRGRIGYDTVPGLGTTFWFELVLTTDVSETPGQASPTILICEDNRDVAQALLLTIELEGYQAVMAATAADARELLDPAKAGLKIDALVLDLGLPDEDGLDMLRDLRSRNLAQIPVIILSGSTPTCTDDLTQVSWLHKPISAAELAHALTGLVKERTGGLPRLLHVEDDAELRSVVSALMADHARIVGVNSLRDALAALDDGGFDGVILALDLPDGDGSQLLESLARSRPDLPVVLFTDQHPLAETARKAYATLVKSRDSEAQLVDVLTQLLSHRTKG